MNYKYYEIKGKQARIGFKCRAFKVNYYNFGFLGEANDLEITDATESPEDKWKENYNTKEGEIALGLYLQDKEKEFNEWKKQNNYEEE